MSGSDAASVNNHTSCAEKWIALTFIALIGRNIVQYIIALSSRMADDIDDLLDEVETKYLEKEKAKNDTQSRPKVSKRLKSYLH